MANGQDRERRRLLVDRVTSLVISLEEYGAGSALEALALIGEEVDMRIGKELPHTACELTVRQAEALNA